MGGLLEGLRYPCRDLLRCSKATATPSRSSLPARGPVFKEMAAQQKFCSNQRSSAGHNQKGFEEGRVLGRHKRRAILATARLQRLQHCVAHVDFGLPVESYGIE
eukprot:s5710_g10.t1